MTLAVGATLAVLTALASPAQAAGRDSDRDGMPNAWERVHHLNPFGRSDAKADPDRDRLTNLAEYRLRGNPRDEDTDNDGQDDGDERLTRTKVNRADTDRDGVPDGDEDFDRDGVDNEDEDDARESCRDDDDDLDRDDVDDEDENELRLRVGKADTDRDGIRDGSEDFDRDGKSNEDEDDSSSDRCDGDRDDDGQDDEDEGDFFGTIVSFTSGAAAGTGELVVQGPAGQFTVLVTPSTEIEFDDDSSGRGSDDTEDAGSVADLKSGVGISELEFEDGQLEEIELVPAATT
jgi:hypothetical protein